MTPQSTDLSGPQSAFGQGAPSVSTHESPPVGPLDSEGPTKIGPYTLLGIIGEGTNGRVYRARRDAGGPTVALKHVCLDSAQIRGKGIDYFRERIKREARALDRLRSPHTVGLLDFIEISPEAFGIVMEYAEGPTLHDMLCSNGRLGVDRAIELAIQIGGAMEQIHRAGTIHRDLKPSNVVVSRRPDGSDFVRLLDFGTVRGEHDATITSDFIGTPLYASPEQFRNNSVGPGTDIYSLGALLYHMVVGEPPYVGSSIPTVVRKHICDPVPSMRCQRGIQVPASLDELVTDMLQKSPAKRPATMREVVRRLTSIVHPGSDLSPAPPLACRELGEVPTTLDDFDGHPRFSASWGEESLAFKPTEADDKPVTVLYEQGELKALRLRDSGVVHLMEVREGYGRVIWSSRRAIDLVEIAGDTVAVAAGDGTLQLFDRTTAETLVEVRHDRPLTALKLDRAAQVAIAIRNDGVVETIPWDGEPQGERPAGTA